MIKEYIETCETCHRTVAEEGVDYTKYGYPKDEFCSCGGDPSKNTLMVTFRNNHYAHSFAYIKELVDEAKKDFPNLKDQDRAISIVHFGGERYKRTWGIEFFVTNVDREILEGYDRRLQSEFLL